MTQETAGSSGERAEQPFAPGPGEQPIVPALYRHPDRKCAVCRFGLRVRYAETDRMGIAYNAHYLTWFEIGRTELMRCSGMSYREIEEQGILLPMVEAGMKLRVPILYDDLIRIEAWVSRIRSRAIVFSYEIYTGSQLAAEGSTTHASLAAGGRDTVMLPKWVRDRLAPLLPVLAD